MLEAQPLVEAATTRAGTDDLGEDTWQEGLGVLVRALNVEGTLNELGEQVFWDQIVGYLGTRLEIERWYRDYPEIDQQEIVSPLFGVGMPRTGSTALSFLLARDRSRRFLRTWEASAPCPPPETATQDTDPRIAAAQAEIDLTTQMFPNFVGMLPTSATGPQECLLLMALDFRSQVFEGMALLPSYTEWLLSCDMEPAYRYHQRVLKLLQWHCPPTRWWLKTPSHMASIDALNALYPDARFVMTHRDMGSVLPSLCALKQALSSPLSTGMDLRALGRHEMTLWSESLRRLLEFRDAGREPRFFDLSFGMLQEDPLGAMEGLYAAFDDELTDDTRRRMSQWWVGSAKHRRGGRPDSTVFGIDPAAMHEQFAFYHQRFGITSD